MSADYVGECPACESENFAAYQEFYIKDGALHAGYGAECRESWGGCGYAVDHDFEPWPLPGLPIKPPDTGFTGLI